MAKEKRFRPRRGKASTLKTKNPVLLSGELIIEVPEAGVGKGKVKIKMGDGVTAYNSLPYAVMDADPAQDSAITFTVSTTNDNATLLNEISSGRKIPQLWGSTKKLLSNLNTAINDMGSKYNSFESAKSKIISSGLGSALGMSSTTTLADVANKIAAVVNRGAWNGSITSSGGSVTIPAGYHNGSGKVTGPTLATLVGTNVNCDSNARLLSGYTAYGKNGVKYTGSHTCPTLATLVGTNVNCDSNARLLSGYTAYGKNGVKYTGSHTCATLATLVGSNVTLASAASLLSGVTAYGKNGVKYTGTHTCPSASSILGGAQFTVTEGTSGGSTELTATFSIPSGKNTGIIFCDWTNTRAADLTINGASQSWDWQTALKQGEGICRKTVSGATSISVWLKRENSSKVVTARCIGIWF